MVNGPFKVDIRNGDLEELGGKKIIGLFSDQLGPNAQTRLDNDKLELKKYTKSSATPRRIRDRREDCVKIICAQWGPRGGKPKMGSDFLPEYAGIQDYDCHGFQCTTDKIGGNYFDETGRDSVRQLPGTSMRNSETLILPMRTSIFRSNKEKTT
jgi:hypothetical protein